MLLFEYIFLDVEGLIPQKRPYVPIKLTNGDIEIQTVGLVDSGADICAINEALARNLGLEMTNRSTRTIGIGSAMQSCSTQITLGLETPDENIMFELPIRILIGDRTCHYPILGRDGFFTTFRVTVDEKNETVGLEKHATLS
jgi:hypothetical protein